MSLLDRAARHVRLSAHAREDEPLPVFLILYINSICNQACEHCLYWKNLNRKDDLSFDELVALSEELGPIENLNLSGGEPFLRKEFAEVCAQFIRRNGVKRIYVPTNGSFAERTVKAIEGTLREPALEAFTAELSLDGMPEFHDKFRGMKDAFARAMETYDALVELQKRDARLRIHAISTATNTNTGELRRLTEYLAERCPAMDHHTLGMIRGDRKNPTLEGPALDQYRALYAHVRKIWDDRQRGRKGSSVEPMLQWAKTKTAEEKRQVIPCKAGRLSGVVFSNGDVSLCETHAPIGNLRSNTFRQIWRSEEARSLRKSIDRRECWCTNEMFLWPSIVFQPGQLVKAMAVSRFSGDRAPKAADPAELRVIQ